ncbi:TetR family transcriptional regulator [Pseudonocardia spirodelae]|uniref:TetR family transcriptional regulator n=1 Tax=Pseudonocardia spirodelae TaxID=3133431 RepID=A0ABU8T9W7_9PSEU
MPRRKQVPDSEVLDHALAVLHDGGPRGLTFAALAAVCGLAPATLVQRFGGRGELLRRALLHAWDGLQARTARLGADAEPTPGGAVAFLVALSEQYGGIDSYADALLVLREDLRDPQVRRRGVAWRETLTAVLAGCLGGDRVAAGALATQWQGCLLWWSFDPHRPVTEHVRDELTAFVDRVLSPPAGSARGGTRTGP